MADAELERVQLRRTKGWRMPPDTVKVDRSTRWGNPFVIGRDGSQAECVQRFRDLMAGQVVVEGGASSEEQGAYLAHAHAHRAELRGKHLACWCRLGTPCHADVLLAFVNAQPGAAHDG